MQTKATCSPAEQDVQTDQAILGLLLDSPRPLAVDEVIRQMADEIAARDGLSRLTRDGLAHQLDGFVFASRAATRATELHG